jgi:hypothetical protein
LIYISGSRLIDVIDEMSDYDIVIYTLGGEYIDSSQYEYLMYKGKKVHWYYKPINKISDIATYPITCGIGNMFINYLCDDFIIYKNPKYDELVDKIYAAKNQISYLSAYYVFIVNKSLIEQILTEGHILEAHYTKYIYHMCVASYAITNEMLDKDFLADIKRIRLQPVSDKYNQLAVNRLRIYKNYLEQNPINVEAYIENIYDELELNRYEIS